MKMTIHNFQQGSLEWLAHRRQFKNASDAPAMMGQSKYKTRTQLLDECSTGIVDEIDPATQRLFNEGHEAEAKARPLAAEIIGEDLFPVVGSRGDLGASFDGLTLFHDTAFEHKLLNDDIRACQSVEDLHPQYHIQMEQQCMVSGCERVLFLATEWDGDRLVDSRQFWYTSNPKLAKQIDSGWKQFDQDLANHTPQAKQVKAVGESPDTLPALVVQVQGAVTQTNLPQFKQIAVQVLGTIKTELSTDQDFADAETTVKWCKDVEKRLDTAKDAALAQTATIDELFRTIDDIKEQTRQKRLQLEKLVKTQKDQIRLDIVNEAQDSLKEYCRRFPVLQGFAAPVPAFAEAIKGKKTLDSMRDAISVELARCRAEVAEFAADLQAKVEWIEGQNLTFAIHDRHALMAKPMEDMQAAIQVRLTEHQNAIAQQAKQLAEQQQREAEAKAAQEIAPKAQEVDTTASQPANRPGNGPVKAAKSVSSRPTDQQIIEVLSMHFRVHESKVIEWLCEMDLSSIEVQP